MIEDTQENALYVKALRELNKVGRQSEHHKVATTPKEIDFMHDAQRVVSRQLLMIPYAPNQFENIFGGNK